MRFQYLKQAAAKILAIDQDRHWAVMDRHDVVQLKQLSLLNPIFDIGFTLLAWLFREWIDGDDAIVYRMKPRWARILG